MVENVKAKEDFGSIGMALSCTLFLEGALKQYKKYADLVDSNTISVITEWNKVLISLLQNYKYRFVLGDIGNSLINGSRRFRDYIQKCVECAPDVNVQSLHYILRFQENMRFLDAKYNIDKNLCLCDLGCGLSPLAVLMQTKYNLQNVYAIDIMPEICDLYTNAAYKFCGKMPTFIDWKTAQDKSMGIDTITSIGCLPHMPIESQKEYMKIIDKNFPNFFLEIKYKKSYNLNNSENAFSLQDLQKLRVDVQNVTDIEMAIIRNSLRYLNKFVRAKPDRKDFLVNQSRSLFLCR